jgi:hypothetical protein
MGLTDLDTGSGVVPPKIARVRPRSPFIAAEFEAEIGRLYLRLMEEPVPPRLLTIVRAAMAGSKP